MNPADARHAFITGGASGMGLAIADSLGRRGIAITIVDIDAVGLHSLATTGRHGSQHFILDVRDRAAWAEVKASAEAR